MFKVSGGSNKTKEDRFITLYLCINLFYLKLFYRIVGDGYPLVILHGLFGSSDNWQTFARGMADQYKVISLDLRNHGNSMHTYDFNYNSISQDIRETLSELQLDQYHLLGHSMGGKAAAYHTLENPDRVSKLVIIDIAMRAYPPHHDRYFDAMLSMDLNQITNRMEAENWLSNYIHEEIVRKFLLKSLIREESGKFKWKFGLDELYTSYDVVNRAITSDHPFTRDTLIVSGDRSDYITDQDQEYFLKLFPKATFSVIAQAGHWVQADQPLALQNILLDFLSK